MAVQSLSVMFAVFGSQSAAIAAAAHIEDRVRESGERIDGAAVLASDSAARLLFHEVGKLSRSDAPARGAVLGAVIGMLFHPDQFASAFLSASIAALVDRVETVNLVDPKLRQLGARLTPNQAALVVVGIGDAVNEIAESLLGYESLARRRLNPDLVAAVHGSPVTTIGPHA
jgi:uncharacterized membrane protein